MKPRSHKEHEVMHKGTKLRGLSAFVVKSAVALSVIGTATAEPYSKLDEYAFRLV